MGQFMLEGFKEADFCAQKKYIQDKVQDEPVGHPVQQQGHDVRREKFKGFHDEGVNKRSKPDQDDRHENSAHSYPVKLLWFAIALTTEFKKNV